MKKALVVENDYLEAMDLQMRLSGLGFDVIGIVDTGAKALEKVEAFEPEIVLMDIGLSGDMDGIETAKLIRTGYAIPVVFITAQSDDEVIQRAQGSDPYGYIIKPFSSAMIDATITTALHLHDLERKGKAGSQRNKVLFQNSRDIIFAIDIDGHFIDANDSALNLIGCTREEFKTIDFESFLSPDQASQARNEMREIAETGGQVKPREYTIRLSGGRELHFSFTFVMQFQDGKPFSFIGIGRDLTDRKRAEEKLAESEAKYRTLVETQTDLISRWLPDTTLSFVNDAYAKFYGRSCEALVGTSWMDLIPEEEQKEARTHFDGLSRHPVKHEYSRALIDGKGTRRWINWVDMPILDGMAAPVEFLSIGRDITSARLAEESLRDSERRFETVIEQIDEYVYSVDYHKGMPGNRYHSPKCWNITGYEPADFESDPDLWLSMIHESDRANVLDYLAGIQAGKSLAPIEHRIVRKDGTISWILNTCTAEFDDKGSIRRTQGFIIDMNERIMMEHEILEAMNTAETANRAKSEFLASMSHELRTPLNSIIGFSQLLTMDKSETLSEKQKSFIQDIKSSGDHLLSMIGDILDLAKIESGKIDIQKKPFDFASMLYRLSETMHVLADKKEICLAIDIAPDIGILDADEVRIRQILYNLLSNAIKFTGSGKTVGIKARGEEYRAIITIWDEGIGIAEEDQKRIFEPFEQVRRMDVSNQGTGLGLSITQHLVSLHGGSIKLMSEAGKGSRFTITLPGRRTERRAPDKKNAADPIRPASLDSCADSTKVEGAKGILRGEILVVEDNPLNQRLILEILAAFGCTASIAASGEDAVDMTASRCFDLILMDINLPGIDGIETMRRIRRRSDVESPGNRRAVDFRTYIVALTAHALKGDQERFIVEGMDDVLSKPIDIDRLKDILEKYLSVRKKSPGEFHGKESSPSPEPASKSWDIVAASASVSLPVDALRSLVEYFFTDLADEYMGNLAAAIEVLAYTEIRNQAHKLRGSVASLRFSACAVILGEIEQAAEMSASTDYSRLLACLKAELEIVKGLSGCGSE